MENKKLDCSFSSLEHGHGKESINTIVETKDFVRIVKVSQNSNGWVLLTPEYGKSTELWFHEEVFPKSFDINKHQVWVNKEKVIVIDVAEGISDIYLFAASPKYCSKPNSKPFLQIVLTLSAIGWAFVASYIALAHHATFVSYFLFLILGLLPIILAKALSSEKGTPSSIKTFVSFIFILYISLFALAGIAGMTQGAYFSEDKTPNDTSRNYNPNYDYNYDEGTCSNGVVGCP